jgi:hypothetical protein
VRSSTTVEKILRHRRGRSVAAGLPSRNCSAARAATLTIARLDPQGGVTPLAVVATVAGARNAVATRAGTAYLTDSAADRILVVAPAVSP